MGAAIHGFRSFRVESGFRTSTSALVCSPKWIRSSYEVHYPLVFSLASGPPNTILSRKIDITIIPKDVQDESSLDDTRFCAQLILDDFVCEQTELVAKDETSFRWKLSDTFLVPFVYSSFSIGIVKIDGAGIKTHQGAVEIITEQIEPHASKRETHIVVQTSTQDDKEFLEISFTAYSSTSNLAKGPSPASVISSAKSMNREAIISLLTQIVISDTTFMNPDLGLLSTVYILVFKLPRDGVHRPRALGLLANIYLARYDTFSKIIGEGVENYPMYVIYAKGIDVAISMLDQALDLAADDYPKRPWLMITLGMCLQRKLQEQIENPDVFRTFALKMYDVVPNIPDSEVQKPAFSNYLGTVFGQCFEHTKNPSDLDSSIALHEDAIRLTSDDSPSKVPYLMALVTALLDRVELQEEAKDIDRLIAVQEEVLSLAPADFAGRVPILGYLGHSYFTRYNTLSDVAFLEKSIKMYEESLDLLSNDHPVRPSVLNNLAASLSVTHQGLDTSANLSRAVTLVHEAVQLTSNTDPVKLQYIVNLGNAVLSHLELTGAWNVDDFKVYIDALQAAILHLTITESDTDDDFIFLSGNFEKFTMASINGLPDSVVLEQVIPLFESTIDTFPQDLSSIPSMFYNLGSSLHHSFTIGHDSSLLNQSIGVLNKAIELLNEPSSSRKALWKSTLGTVFLTRFLHFGEQRDIEKAQMLMQSSLDEDILPNGHHDRPPVLRNLGNLHFQHFLKTSDPQLLDRSIEYYRDMLNQSGLDTRRERSRWLNDFAAILSRRFEASARQEDIDDAISILESSLSSLHNDPSIKAKCLQELSRLLFFRFHRLQDIDDLDRAFISLEDSTLTSLEQPDAASLNSQHYANMSTYFETFSGADDIKMCIKEIERIALTPSSPSDDLRIHHIGMFLSLALQRPNILEEIRGPALESLENVINAIPPSRMNKDLWFSMLLAMFKQARRKEDLDKAITIAEKSIEVSRDVGGRSTLGKQFTFSVHLSSFLKERFNLSGDLADLNRSIKLLEDATMISSINDPTHYHYRLLNALAVSYMQRYDLLGDVSDFNKSALVSQEAMASAGENHPDRYILQQSVALLHQRKLKISGALSDAELAVDTLRSIVESLPEGSQELLDAMVSYGNALLNRYWHFRATEDIDEAIETLEAVRSQLPNDSDKKARIFHDLGSAFAQRFVQTANLEDINKCISMLEDANALMPDDDPTKYMLLFDIGRWLPTRYERLHDQKDLEKADAALGKVASLPSSPYMWQFRAASLRSYWKQDLGRGSTLDLEGYMTAMALLPKVAWLGMSVQNRQFRLIEVGDVVLDAVAAAIESSRYDLAVEWLEEGRSITWGQMLELRAPVDILHESHPELAARFAALSSALGGIESEQGAVVPQGNNDAELPNTNVPKSYHEIANEREKLLLQIRSLEGFHDFLLPKKISELFGAASYGPVITLNINKFRCDALVLLPGKTDILHIPLKGFSASEAHTMMKTMKQILRSKNGVRSDDRAPKKSPFLRRSLTSPEAAFEDILSKLWVHIAKPILDEIGLTTVPEGSSLPRIWWCVTGPMTLLPIHAAGTYRKDQTSKCKISDYVVSSYIPSLSALLRCSQPREIRKKKLIAIALPVESGLPCTESEIEVIQKHNPVFPVQSFIESEATYQNVVRGLEDAGWVHFACHGIQDQSDPTQSALMLFGDKKLTLSDISKLSLPHAELAFLSACQTAAGDELLPEEAVHLAAGMLSAGYQGVVGTMWSIADSEGPKVAEEFYRHIFSKGAPDPAEAAYALHSAVKVLRDNSDSKTSFFDWVPFVHYGV